jgi:hypothetical protein
VIVAVDDVVAGQILRAIHVAVALLAVWISVESDGAVVAGTTSVALFADTLTRFHVARLLHRTHLVTIAVLAAF